jgi:hypothetical protein
MPLSKKANGANFKVSGGELTVQFDAGGPAVVHVVCIWGPKPAFGGQRPKLWCSETEKSSKDGATVTVPEGMAVAGSQVTWSGGLIAKRGEQGRLLVTVAEQGGESESFSYEYQFTQRNQTESFYDGLNFTSRESA